MYRVRQQDLPFQGSSHHFVGEYVMTTGGVHGEPR